MLASRASLPHPQENGGGGQSLKPKFFPRDPSVYSCHMAVPRAELKLTGSDPNISAVQAHTTGH